MLALLLLRFFFCLLPVFVTDSFIRWHDSQCQVYTSHLSFCTHAKWNIMHRRMTDSIHCCFFVLFFFWSLNKFRCVVVFHLSLVQFGVFWKRSSLTNIQHSHEKHWFPICQNADHGGRHNSMNGKCKRKVYANSSSTLR